MLKNLLFSLLYIGLPLALFGQANNAKINADKFLFNKTTAWKLTQQDIANATVSDMYTDKDGNTFIYYQQTVNGLPIYNAVTPVVVSKSGKVNCVASRFIQNTTKKISISAVKISAVEAVEFAAQSFGRKTRLSSKRSNGATTFEDTAFVHNIIHPKKEYILVGDKLELVWSMDLDLTNTSDYWNTKISATDGRLITKHNYAVNCRYKHGKYDRHAKCINSNTVRHSVTQTITNPGAKYNVFPLPLESPIDGERKIITDDLFPKASPFGWHDTDGIEGAEHTITKGNNVHVFLDREATGFSNGDEPDGSDILNFDFTYDINAEADSNVNASQVNLFTTINQTHDILYKLGFDEAAGNFQVNNYDKGGRDNDHVKAHAFRGIDKHLAGTDEDDPQINNASFKTLPDGSSPEMELFLWGNNGGIFSIDKPTNISGFLKDIGTANFGNPLPSNDQDPISGKLVLATDGSPANATRCCKDIIKIDELSGNIAILDRGECNFSVKVYNAQQAGAKACIICNISGADGPGSSGENIINMNGGTNAEAITIPSVFLTKSSCDLMRSEILKGTDVRITLQEREPKGPRFRDSGLDNGIVAHEYGHGLSNRIIGGPSQTGCLTTLEQMGEGISDFVTLLLTLKDGDTREISRGIGNYAEFKQNDGSGIRTYPYSTDISVNPREYDNMTSLVGVSNTSARYPIGEIWATTLWDVLWNIVDKKGIDETWKDENTGNFVMGRLFVKGMQLAPCNPSFIDMRDALLAADELLYKKEHEYEIWAAFAKRGMGYEAEGGSSDVLDDGKSSYDILPLAIKTLKIHKDGKSLVKSGEEVTVTLSADNHIPETKYDVVITDEIPEGAVYIPGSANIEPTINDNQLSFTIDSMTYEENVQITYKIQVNESLKSTTTYYDNIDDGNGNYDYKPLEGFTIWQVTDIEANSGEQSLYIKETDNQENQQIIELVDIGVLGDNPVLRFYHKYDTQISNDGGFLSISNDGGQTYTMIADKFIRNGYNTDLNYNVFAIPNLRGFSGTSEGKWVDSYVDLNEYKGQKINIRIRFGTDEEIASEAENPGWFVDDIEIIDLSTLSTMACISSDGTDDQCSNPLEILVNSNTPINTSTVELENYIIALSPNPANDYITVKIDAKEPSPLQLTLMSMDGKIIKRQNTYSKNSVRTFDVSEVKAGMYLMKIDTPTRTLSTQKVVVF